MSLSLMFAVNLLKVRETTRLLTLLFFIGTSTHSDPDSKPHDRYQPSCHIPRAL